MTAVRTTCPYCGVGCGIIATLDPAGRVAIQGDPEHPANHGRLCSKGAALGETVGLEGRLLYPEVAGRRVDWDTALDTVAGRFRQVIEAHRPEAVAFYVSGQLLSEDYYVANKLMKGFIGAANIDTNSRLCMASAVAGHKRAFGADAVPCGYQDVELADLVVLVGANAAWCHPVLYQRLAAAGREGRAVVVVDPRRTATCEGADLHLPLAPGSDALLFDGLLVWLAEQGLEDGAFTGGHTQGRDAALAAARASAPSLAAVAAGCGLEEAAVRAFYRLFGASERVVTLFSQGINQSESGTDKVNAIINCHLFTGRLGRPGMGPFSLTGQPNAMGGREVGGLSNQLAAHMELEDPHQRALVWGFWDSPVIAAHSGPKAVELFAALGEGRIKALWVMGTNPAVSLPQAERVRAALEQCEFLVVSDCVADTDTVRLAHVRLPALTWGERDGTVTNSERRISRQRPFLPPPGQARADWWIVAQVAARLGHARQFAYAGPADIFREHARLSALANNGRRAFDISGLAGLADAAYDALAPVQWPVTAAHPQGTARLFADGRFYTPDGRARLVPVTPRPPVGACDREWPLLLNSGRLRDQWHTMTRTGRSPRLAARDPEPAVEVHPHDAAACGIGDGELVVVESRHGRWLGRAQVTPGQRPGSLFVPMHWNDQFAGRARAGGLIAAVTDPVSGQPQLKQTPVRLVPWRPAWQGFFYSREPLAAAPACGYWSRARGPGYWRYELAGEAEPADWGAFARELLGAQTGEWTEFHDRAARRYRAARLDGGRLDACLFVGPGVDMATRDWLAELFRQGQVGATERALLLAGRPPAGQVGEGRPVCACFGVGLATLERTIREQRLTSVAAVGKALKAGTGCGSCIAELRAVVERARA